MIPKLSVIVPANNEAQYISRCLKALLASDSLPGGAEAVIVANGCTDDTAEVARSFADRAGQCGWGWTVLDLPDGGKMGALNAGDAVAQGVVRAYLDADVIVSPSLLGRITQALTSTDRPAYASGRPLISPARSFVTRAYARLWAQLPFARSEAPGFGLFAVNAAGRARWGIFPDIISDDTFVRLSFTPDERIEVPASYEWPMVEGFSRLVRVRRRQDRGVAQIAQQWPALMQNEAKQSPGPGAIAKLALMDPVGFAVYGAVSLAVRIGKGDNGWTRGR